MNTFEPITGLPIAQGKGRQNQTLLGAYST